MIGPLGISTTQLEAGTVAGLPDATCMAAAVALVPNVGIFARHGVFVLHSSHAPKLLLCPHYAQKAPSVSFCKTISDQIQAADVWSSL
jgi:hypothetical protein